MITNSSFSNPLFTTNTTYSHEGSAYDHIYVGVLAGSPYPSIVTTNYHNDTVSVRFGNGDGTFQRPVPYHTASMSGPSGVYVADVLPVDDVPDIIVANYLGSTISIFPGYENGTFGTPASFNTPTGPIDVFATQLNNNGSTFIITANELSDSVSVFNIINSTLSYRYTYTVGTKPYSVHAADIDGSGYYSIATANYGTTTVSILRGYSNATFATATSHTVGSQPISVRFSTIGTSTYPALAVADYTDDTISIFQNYGNGTFHLLGTDYDVGGGPVKIEFGDVNGDGINDAVVASSTSNITSVWLGQADGTLTSWTDYDLTTSPSDLVLGAFIVGDKANIFTINGDTYGSVAALINTYYTLNTYYTPATATAPASSLLYEVSTAISELLSDCTELMSKISDTMTSTSFKSLRPSHQIKILEDISSQMLASGQSNACAISSLDAVNPKMREYFTQIHESYMDNSPAFVLGAVGVVGISSMVDTLD